MFAIAALYKMHLHRNISVKLKWGQWRVKYFDHLLKPKCKKKKKNTLLVEVHKHNMYVIIFEVYLWVADPQDSYAPLNSHLIYPPALRIFILPPPFCLCHSFVTLHAYSIFPSCPPCSQILRPLLWLISLLKRRQTSLTRMSHFQCN